MLCIVLLQLFLCAVNFVCFCSCAGSVICSVAHIAIVGQMPVTIEKLCTHSHKHEQKPNALHRGKNCPRYSLQIFASNYVEMGVESMLVSVFGWPYTHMCHSYDFLYTHKLEKQMLKKSRVKLSSNKRENGLQIKNRIGTVSNVAMTRLFWNSLDQA